MDDLLLWAVRRFPGELSLVSVKIEGVLWSIIDVCLAVAVLKIFDLARAGQGKPRIRIRYLLVGVSAVLIPFLVVVKAHMWFWLLECGIIGLHLAILVVTAVMDGPAAMVMLRTVRSTLLERGRTTESRRARS